MKTEIPVTDSDLHAWLDGQLSETRRLQVEAWLESHPEKLQALQKYQQLDEALHELLDPIVREPVPESLRVVPHRRILRRIAAAVSFLMIGGIAGWQSNSLLLTADNQHIEYNLVKPAMFAHVVYSTEVKHPVEVVAEQEQHLIKWLSNRLHTSIKAPNLLQHGYSLVGGRLLPSTEDRMAAQFMYQSKAGVRMTLYVRRIKNFEANAQFQFVQNKGVNAFYWVEGELGYALSGELTRDELLGIANVCYQQLL